MRAGGTSDITHAAVRVLAASRCRGRCAAAPHIHSPFRHSRPHTLATLSLALTAPPPICTPIHTPTYAHRSSFPAPTPTAIGPGHITPAPRLPTVYHCLD